MNGEYFSTRQRDRQELVKQKHFLMELLKHPDSFYKLLRVMKDTQSNVCIQLVESMTSELPSDMVAKFNLGNNGGEQDQSADHSKPA